MKRCHDCGSFIKDEDIVKVGDKTYCKNCVMLK